MATPTSPVWTPPRWLQEEIFVPEPPTAAREVINRYGTFVGLALGILSIFGSFLLAGGAFGNLFLITPMLIVFGGTFSAAIVGSGWERFIGGWRVARLAFFPPRYDARALLDILVPISVRAKRDGLLSADYDASKLRDPFLRRTLQAAIDGIDRDSLKLIGEDQMARLSDRHALNAGLFLRMGGYSPTMGIIGTVMGLIMTLASAGGDPNQLISHMAQAFIATLWGIFAANIIWLPIADRLRTLHQEEIAYMEVALEGVLAIQAGEPTSVVWARLASMLPGGGKREWEE